MNQSFRRDTVVSDGVPLVNTQRADFGLDYNLPHNTRILTSYSGVLLYWQLQHLADGNCLPLSLPSLERKIA